MTTVVFPDALTVVLGYLRPALTAWADTDVSAAKVVTVSSQTFPQVLLRRDGGLAGDFLHDRPRITARCWHTSPAKAMKLAQIVRGLLLAYPGQTDDVAGPTEDLGADLPAGASGVLVSVQISLRGEPA